MVTALQLLSARLQNYSWARWVAVLPTAVIGYVFLEPSFFLAVVVSLGDGDLAWTTTDPCYFGPMSFSSTWARRPRSLQTPLILSRTRGPTAACCTQYIRCCPLCPAQSQSAELPQTRGSRRESDPRKDTRQDP